MNTTYESAVRQYLLQHQFDQLVLKAVLFDMDGVLFDSMPNHARSWAQVCTRFGLDMTPEEAYLHEGRTGASTINILTQRQWGRNATEEEIAKIYEEKCHLFNACPEAEKMKGAEPLLHKIKAEQLGLFVVTGSGQKSLLDRLDEGFPGIFNRAHIVSSRDVKHGKPHPEPYLLGLSRAQVHPYEAIVVENAPLGVQAAAAANIFTIAVNTGPLNPKVLEEAGANLVFPSMQALCDVWDDLYSTLKNKRYHEKRTLLTVLLLAATTLFMPAQNKLTLQSALNNYMPEGMRNIIPMKDGETYTQLSNDGKRFFAALSRPEKW